MLSYGAYVHVKESTEPQDILHSVETRYRDTMDRVRIAAERAGKSAREIYTVAVTKYATMEQVEALLDCGHVDLGESRVPQMIQRAALLNERRERKKTFASAAERSELHDLRWHMIGHLQRNKAKRCVEYARLIHSVDSLRLVDELGTVAMKLGTVSEVLVQVNTTEEESKSGCAVGAAAHLCEQVDSLVDLKLRGIMVMGPTSQDHTETRIAFERARELFDDLRRRGVGEGAFNILSMGMSGDFELAIECGSNMLRLGSAIFGEREMQDDQLDLDK